MSQSSTLLKTALQKKATSQLISIKHYERKKYSAEALDLVDQILEERNISAEALVKHKSNIRKRRKEEKAELRKMKKQQERYKGWKGKLLWIWDSFWSFVWHVVWFY